MFNIKTAVTARNARFTTIEQLFFIGLSLNLINFKYVSYIFRLFFTISRLRCYGDNRCRWRCAQNKTQLNEAMKQLYSADRHSPTPTKRKRQLGHTHTHARLYSFTHTYAYKGDIILEDNWLLLRRVSPQFTAHLGWLAVWRLPEGLIVKWRSAALRSAPLFAVSCHESFVRRSIANTLIPEGCRDSSWRSRFRHFARLVVSLRWIYM